MKLSGMITIISARASFSKYETQNTTNRMYMPKIPLMELWQEVIIDYVVALDKYYYTLCLLVYCTLQTP